ncbi:PAS domain-containing protein [Mucilaginibacter sp.]
MSSSLSLNTDQILEVLSLSKNATAIYVGEDIVIQSANESMISLWGKDKNVIGKPIEEALPELKGQPFKKILQDVLKTGITSIGESIPATLMIDGTLQTSYYDYEYCAIKNEAGLTYCILHTASDVTERELNRIALQKAKEIETAQTKALIESDRNLRSFILQAPVAIALFKGPDYIVEIANNKALELWGRELDEVINKPILETMPELRSQGVKELLDHVYQTGETFSATELPVKILRDGKLIDAYINFVYEAQYDAEGNINGLITIGTEVTEQVLSRKKIEDSKASLLASEQRLYQIISQLPAPIVVLSGPNQVVETTNNSLLSFWNRTKDEVLGKPMLEIFPELSNQPFPAQWKHVYETGETITNRERPVTFKTKDGGERLFYVDYYYQPLTDIHGKPVSVLATVIDVTDKVESRNLLEDSADALQAINEELAASNEELANINKALDKSQSELEQTLNELKKAQDVLLLAIEASDMSTWTADLKTDELIVDDKAREIHGIPKGEKVTLAESLSRIDPEYKDRITTAIGNAVANNQPFKVEYIFNPIDGGSQKWLKSMGKAYYDVEGNPLYITGTILDITEQKSDEQRKNDFIGMVSHELKTPLTSLTAIVQVMDMKLKNSNDVFMSGAMGKASIQVKKMSNMINGFLNISRLESGKILIEKQVFEIDGLIREVIDEIQLTAFTHDIILSSCPPIKVNADRDKIGSVISNLLTNAIKYSPKALQIIVDCKKIDENNVRVSVKDEGMGIKPEDIDKLFDRYYRVENKQTTNISGFGIGLYLSAEIIHRHNGKIWAESEVGKGSTFYFTLPL